MMAQPVPVVRSRPSAIALTVLFAVLGLVTGCATAAASSEWGGGVATPLAAPTVVIKNFAFGPAAVTVAPGTKVTVINEDQATHTLTARDRSFDTGPITGGRRAEITAPATPGHYPYFCGIHQYMTGTLTVQ
jgi:plastocyanin